MSLPRLILASASPRRTELLRQLNLEFEVMLSDATELHIPDLTAREISQLNAYRKVRTIAKRYPDALVIGADTLVYLDTALYGKPTDSADARRMLGELQGRTHEVVTGVCLLHLRAHRQRLFAETTQVTFRQLTAEQIHEYLSAINPFDKAGSYAIQEQGGKIVSSILGSYSNVVGLPVERLASELSRWQAG